MLRLGKLLKSDTCRKKEAWRILLQLGHANRVNVANIKKIALKVLYRNRCRTFASYTCNLSGPTFLFVFAHVGLFQRFKRDSCKNVVLSE